MTRVLVLDAEQRSALAVVRSLGAHGATVLTASRNARSLGGVSRYSERALVCPDAATNASGFVSFVERSVRDLHIDQVLPVTDTSTLLLTERSSTLGCGLLCAAPASYAWMSDKGRLVDLAVQLGVPAPETILARTREQIVAAAGSFGFPLVLKPSRSKYREGEAVLSTAVVIVATEAQLQIELQNLHWLASMPCLVQRFIPGHGAGIFAIYGKQGPVAWFAHRRLREKPPAGGVSVLSESSAPDPVLQDYAARLLGAAGWFGPAMIEFRIATDGKPYLIEINGRFWGSLQLAVDCGVDFPWLLLQLGVGETPKAQPGYPVGRRLRWLLGDTDNLLIQLRRPAPGTARSRICRAYGSSFFDPRCRQEVFRWSDARPGLLEMRQWLAAAVS